MFISGLSISVLSGLYTCLWGAFKDSPYEGLKNKTFPRSIYFNSAIFCLLFFVSIWHTALSNLSLFQIFFLIMGLERFLAELYKGFFRTEDQQKYFIPSRITLLGKPVISDLLRYLSGTVLVGLVFVVATIPIAVDNFISFVAIAYLTGLFVGLGGAYKDAPFEGFHILKFQRSAVVLVAFSPVFYLLGSVPLGFLIYMNGGLERFSVEYYKTYIQRNMSGKFKPNTRKIQKHLDNREKFHYMALAIILFMVLVYFYELRTL